MTPFSPVDFGIDADVPPNALAATLTSTGTDTSDRPFIPYDPHEATKAKRKACTQCYTKKIRVRHYTTGNSALVDQSTKCTFGRDKTTCDHCLDKFGYCKGPIRTPSLLQDGKSGGNK